MDELLQKLLEAEILSEETKKDLENTFADKLTEAIDVATIETTSTIKAELAEQWITERDALIEAIDSKVTEFLNEEMVELKEDINRFRDLELEYAEKLVESKAQMANELQGDMAELVEKIDSFLEIRLASELSELREDITVQKENNFGRKIFEAVAKEFGDNYTNDDDLSKSLSETQTRLTDTESALKESDEKLAKIERSLKMTEVLSPLTGRKREVMEAILKNVSTEQLPEGYETFIGRILKETAEESKTDETITETVDPKVKKIKINEGLEIKTGDKVTGNDKIEKAAEKLSESALSGLKKIAGL